MSSADICRNNGWLVGTCLIGREHGRGYVNQAVIEITAIGESNVLAKTLSNRSWDEEDGPRDYGSSDEGLWALYLRDWRVAAEGEVCS